MKKKVRFGVIGVRSFGKNAHCVGIAACEDAQLVAVCDILEDIAKIAADEFHVPYYLDYREMLK